jgi:hypothetical protein
MNVFSNYFAIRKNQVSLLRLEGKGCAHFNESAIQELEGGEPVNEPDAVQSVKFPQTLEELRIARSFQDRYAVERKCPIPSLNAENNMQRMCIW